MDDFVGYHLIGMRTLENEIQYPQHTFVNCVLSQLVMSPFSSKRIFYIPCLVVSKQMSSDVVCFVLKSR